MRLFGNCLSGTILVGLVQWALSSASSGIFEAFGVVGTIGTSSFWNNPGWTSIFLAPGPVGVFNSYFSLFSGFIQTLVFSSLSAIWISQEMPEPEPEKKEDVLPASEARPLVIEG
jgi:F0F1-type ATP synthase membrane subunit a